MEFRSVKATLKTSCCLSEQPAMGNEVETLTYIPGSALRGMLAQAYLQAGGKPDADFYALFCTDVVAFPCLYPLGFRPLPLSAYTCKAERGFRNDEREPGEPLAHGVWDLLFEDEPGYQGHENRRCHKSECAYAPLAPLDGMYEPNKPRSESFKKLLLTRTAVSYRKQSAMEASLHSRVELPAGMKFEGVLATSDGTALEHLLDRLPKHRLTAYTGQQRAGQVEILIEELTTTPRPQARFLKWPGDANGLYFTLTLTSDAILIDPLLRPVITLTPPVLTDEQIGFPTDVDISVVKAFCAARRVSGWNSVGRIFKADDVAIVAGSTFLLRVPPAAREVVQAWMEKVIFTGIGLRRSEGFGQVRFDEPLHARASEVKGGPL